MDVANGTTVLVWGLKSLKQTNCQHGIAITVIINNFLHDNWICTHKFIYCSYKVIMFVC